MIFDPTVCYDSLQTYAVSYRFSVQENQIRYHAVIKFLHPPRSISFQILAVFEAVYGDTSASLTITIDKQLKLLEFVPAWLVMIVWNGKQMKLIKLIEW